MCVCVCNLRHPERNAACTAVTYFSALPHKRLDFREKRYSTKKCVFCFSLQLMSEKVLIVRRIQRDININLTSTTCKVPVILVKL
jgi:hypothetical protein